MSEKAQKKTRGAIAARANSTWFLSVILAEPVAKRHQAVGKMHVFDLDLAVGYMQVYIGKIPEPPDPAADQTGSDLRRGRPRKSQHRDLRLILLDILLEGIDMMDLNPADGGADRVLRQM
jgi:hypothetical protein